MTDQIARKLRAEIKATRNARNGLADRIVRLRAEIDGARRVLALNGQNSPALHRALRVARNELRTIVAEIA